MPPFHVAPSALPNGEQALATAAHVLWRCAPIVWRSLRSLPAALVALWLLPGTAAATKAPPPAKGTKAPSQKAPDGARDLLVDGPFEHRSGMVFPALAGSAQRVAVRQFMQAPDDYGITYSLGDPRVATVTVYVYPQVLDLEAEMLQAIESARTTLNAELQSQEPHRLDDALSGRLATLTFSPSRAAPTETHQSRIYLFHHLGWSLKYRASYRLQDHPAVETMIGPLMAALGKPSVPRVASERGPSTQSERQHALELVRLLENEPLHEDSPEARSWLVTWIAEIPDIVVTFCPDLFGEDFDSSGEFGAEILVQQVFSSAAFVIEHPDRAADELAVDLAGVEGALRAYQALLEERPQARSAVLDRLIELQRSGLLARHLSAPSERCHASPAAPSLRAAVIYPFALHTYR